MYIFGMNILVLIGWGFGILALVVTFVLILGIYGGKDKVKLTPEEKAEQKASKAAVKEAKKKTSLVVRGEKISKAEQADSVFSTFDPSRKNLSTRLPQQTPTNPTPKITLPSTHAPEQTSSTVAPVSQPSTVNLPPKINSFPGAPKIGATNTSTTTGNNPTTPKVVLPPLPANLKNMLDDEANDDALSKRINRNR